MNRALMLAPRLNAEVFDVVPHRQWVLTVPKMLRVYFRYDRSLLGKMCREAYGTVCDVYGQESDAGNGVPAMVAAVQSFGDLANFHPHIHAVVPEGVFLDTGTFVPLPDAQTSKVEVFWRERVFRLLLDAHKIDEATVGMMRGWKHSAGSPTRLKPQGLTSLRRRTK